MSLISWLGKLINEHGSAAIMKERLALKDDQIVAKDRKIAELESQMKGKDRKDNPKPQSTSQSKTAQNPEVSQQDVLQPSKNEKILDALGYDILGRRKNNL